MGEYIPQAGKGSDGLPGLGGIYNTVNMHTYHYAGNNPIKLTDPDGKKSGFVTNPGAVLWAGHSAMWVEIYDQNGNSKGFAFFEVNPIDENADVRHGGEPLTLWMALLGGSSAGSSVGSSSSAGVGGSSVGSTVGSDAGASSGVVINEVAANVGVNEYYFATRDEMDKFIAKRWFKDENKTDKIRTTVLNTSKEQDLLIYGAAVSEGNSYGRYDILSNNCAQYAAKVLAAGGVNTSSERVPNWSHDYIDRNNHGLISE